jgi:hypothetical protein
MHFGQEGLVVHASLAWWRNNYIGRRAKCSRPRRGQAHLRLRLPE